MADSKVTSCPPLWHFCFHTDMKKSSPRPYHLLLGSSRGILDRNSNFAWQCAGVLQPRCRCVHFVGSAARTTRAQSGVVQSAVSLFWAPISQPLPSTCLCALHVGGLCQYPSRACSYTMQVKEALEELSRASTGGESRLQHIEWRNLRRFININPGQVTHTSPRQEILFQKSEMYVKQRETCFPWKCPTA
jgi:hypothetical protein